MRLLKTLALAGAILAAVTLLACSGDDGDDGDDGGSPSPSVVTPTPTQPDNQRGFFPPLEGPQRPVAREVVNYWEVSSYDLPDPADLPELLPELSSLAPPEVPVCPDDWVNLDRPTEGFKACYPESYATEGHGYVTAGVDERWYAVGIYDFDGDVELGHVSVYVTGPFSQPFDYVALCDQAYRTTIDGEPATVCPDYDGGGGEKIIAFNMRIGDLDYSINAVPSQSADAAGDIESALLQIVHSFDLIDLISLNPESPSPQATEE